ncbi:MAG TPA: type I-MYXAN CRISPR-associated protein Cas6/Cmx6 [Gallionellaceae bacterium]|nr:type I-MYXAN CRISPR-associated protein Cas6/Cmx6 [Gallionellaceae bacterium]
MMADDSVSQASNIAVPNIESQDMLDVVFDLNGSSVPEGYPFVLWSEVVRCLPWLKDEEYAGILPLRGSASGENTLLSKRTKLVLRVPVERATQAGELSGQQLNIDGNILIVGKGKERQLQATTTLHAHLVESNLSEIEFLADMKRKLQSMNISCNLICDKQRKVRGLNQTLSGFGLVLHDLKPQASIQIQRTGLGGARHFGCGMFVPFKAISGLD